MPFELAIMPIFKIMQVSFSKILKKERFSLDTLDRYIGISQKIKLIQNAFALSCKSYAINSRLCAYDTLQTWMGWLLLWTQSTYWKWGSQVEHLSKSRSLCYCRIANDFWISIANQLDTAQARSKPYAIGMLNISL